jgi:hypothetical protein
VCIGENYCSKTEMLKKTIEGRMDFMIQLGGDFNISWTTRYSEITRKYRTIEDLCFTASDAIDEKEFKKRMEFIEKYNPKISKDIKNKEKMRKLYDTSHPGDKYYETLDHYTHRIISDNIKPNEMMALMDKDINELMNEKMEEAKRIMEREE